MTKRDAKSILVRAFSALPPPDRARLLWHADRGTPVCCGARALQYTDNIDGAG